MSGGHFDYKQRAIEEIIEDLSQVIQANNYSPDIMETFRDGLLTLKKAHIYVQRIDWLLSGDDGEESFRERLFTDWLQYLNENFKKVGQ